MKIKNNFLFVVCFLLAVLFMAGCSYFDYRTEAPKPAPKPVYVPSSSHSKYSYKPNSQAGHQIAQVSHVKYQPSYVTYSYHAAPFDSVAVGGYADVLLTKGNVAVKIKQLNNLPPRYVSVHNHTLVVDIPLEYMGRAFITISAPVFRNIAASNHAFVHSNAITARLLSIEASDSASVNLKGDINLRNIRQTGSAKVSVSWVNSMLVNVGASGNGYISLAGAAKSLIVKLQDSTMFDARYLRAEEVTALTTGSAEAHIYAAKKMDAYAEANSTIYYHNKIYRDMALYSKEQGNVFQGDVLP